MLVITLIIFFIFLYLILYGISKLQYKIEDTEYQLIFWFLYFITVLTFLEICFCIYMYAKYRNKEGELGPKGFQGDPGPQGDKGKCEQANGNGTNCRKDLLVIMIKNIINKYFEDNNYSRRLTPSEISLINNNLSIKNIQINNIMQNKLSEIKQKIIENVENNYIDDSYNITSINIENILYNTGLEN